MKLDSGWSLITQIDGNNHRHLDGFDKCIYYREREHHDWGETHPHYSETYSTISNFKIEPSNQFSNPDRWPYKAKAIRQISDDLRILLNSGQDGFRYVLIPAITSRCKEDPDYDNRLVQVCRLASAEISSVDSIDLLDLDENLPKAHTGGNAREPQDIYSHIIVENHHDLGKRYDYVLLFDDVITTGAHFKACKQAIIDVYGELSIIGVFWAKSLSPYNPQYPAR